MPAAPKPNAKFQTNRRLRHISTTAIDPDWMLSVAGAAPKARKPPGQAENHRTTSTRSMPERGLSATEPGGNRIQRPVVTAPHRFSRWRRGCPPAACRIVAGAAPVLMFAPFLGA